MSKYISIILEALASKNHEIMCVTLKKIQKLVQSGEMIGEALVPVPYNIIKFSTIDKSYLS